MEQPANPPRARSAIQFSLQLYGHDGTKEATTQEKTIATQHARTGAARLSRFICTANHGKNVEQLRQLLHLQPVGASGTLLEGPSMGRHWTYHTWLTRSPVTRARWNIRSGRGTHPTIPHAPPLHFQLHFSLALLSVVSQSLLHRCRVYPPRGPSKELSSCSMTEALCDVESDISEWLKASRYDTQELLAILDELQTKSRLQKDGKTKDIISQLLINGGPVSTPARRTAISTTTRKKARPQVHQRSFRRRRRI